MLHGTAVCLLFVSCCLSDEVIVSPCVMLLWVGLDNGRMAVVLGVGLLRVLGVLCVYGWVPWWSSQFVAVFTHPQLRLFVYASAGPHAWKHSQRVEGLPHLCQQTKSIPEPDCSCARRRWLGPLSWSLSCCGQAVGLCCVVVLFC